MATQKRSISFDEAVLREAEQHAAGNLSAYVNAAVLRDLRVTRGQALLAADEAELGPGPDEIRREVASEWPA
jgi:hypothetical protein